MTITTSHRKGIGGHHRGFRGGSDVWLTPPEILKPLGRFDLDPCSLADRPWDTAALHFWQDGLELPWEGRVWINPMGFSTIGPCHCECHRQPPSDALPAGWSFREIPVISIPAPADPSEFLRVVEIAADNTTAPGVLSGAEKQNHPEMQVGCSDVVDVTNNSPRHWSSSGQSHSAQTDLDLGADSATVSMPKNGRQSVVSIPLSGSVFSLKNKNTPNLQKASNANAATAKSITSDVSRGLLGCHGTGLPPIGENVEPHGATPAHIADEAISHLPKTTSSRFSIPNVPEQFRGTWSLPASDAISQSSISARTLGVSRQNESQRSSITLPTCDRCANCIIGSFPQRIWLNPPYGPECAKWLAKLAKHNNGIAIVFARTETRMFFDHVWPRASALLFIRGRLHFHRADGARAQANAGGPSVLIAYGSFNAEKLKASGIAGQFVPLVSLAAKIWGTHGL